MSARVAKRFEEVRSQIAEVTAFGSTAAAGSKGLYFCNLTSDFFNVFNVLPLSLTNFS